MHHIVFFTCWRYLWTRKIIVLSILGVTIGVMVLIIVMSVMSGFQNDFKSRLQGTLSEISFSVYESKKDYKPLLEKMKEHFKEEILEIAPRLESLILVGTERGWFGSMLIGIDEEQEKKVGNFSSYLFTSKKRLEDEFEGASVSKSILKMEWVFEKVEQISAEDPVFSPATGEQYFRVYYTTETTYHSLPGYSDKKPYVSKSELQAFVFNNAGKIVARESCADLKNKIQTLPSLPEQHKKYQQVLREFSDAFSSKNIARLMSWFHEDLELYNVIVEEGETYREPSPFQLSIKDPFDRANWTQKRYFPILVGTEFMGPRGVFLRKPGNVTILGGYYHQELKKIRSISKKYTIVGTFKTGMHEYDSNIIYCPLQGAQQLQIPPEALEQFDLDTPDLLSEDFPPEGFAPFNRVTHFSIALKDKNKLEEVKKRINQEFGEEGYAETWMDKRRVLLDAVHLEKSVMNFVLNFIILLASVSIIFVLWLMVAEKQKDIGVLRSMGADSFDIVSIFMINGSLIAFLGAIFGTIFGVAFALNVNGLEDLLYQTTGLKVFPRDVYYLDRIPVYLEPLQLAWVIGWTLFTSLLLSIIPAHLASKADPVHCLARQ